MLLTGLSIKHFRCLEDIEVSLDPYVALIGANGVGKSTVIEALRFVLEPNYRANSSDFNTGAPGRPLSVSITCSALNQVEQKAWSGYIMRPEATITLSRTATLQSTGDVSSQYSASAMQHLAFADLREAYKGNKNVFKSAYKSFRLEHPSYLLPNATTADEQMSLLLSWEQNNPEQCELHEAILSKAEVQQLGEAFRVVHVPAVTLVQEVVDGKNSYLDDLIDQVAWGDVIGNPKLVALREEMKQKWDELYPADSPVPELDRAAVLINSSLSTFAPGSSIDLSWRGDGVPRIDPPGYRVRVLEDGSSDDVERKGNGVQRALFVAILNAVAENEAANHPTQAGSYVGPTTLVLVEEPELYQHPTRARHFARSLAELVRVDGSGPQRQVFVTTHSPYFANVSNFASIRLLRRDRSDERTCPQRLMSQTTLDAIWERLRQAKGYASGSDEAIVARNRLSFVFDFAVREGFFADAVVLVEGASDQAAISAEALRRGNDLDARGIAIVHHGGVGELDKLWIIFDSLQIPIFMMFDGDRKTPPNPQDAARNGRLLQLLGATVEEFPSTRVTSNYAVFEVDRESTLREEFGPDYERLMSEYSHASGYERSQGEKTVGIVTEVYKTLHQSGKVSDTLSRICDSILTLV